VRTEAVSVIIPTFNRARLVPRAIESVLNNTEARDEILVIDDGSTDDTASAVRQWGNRVRYIRTENAGPGAARNVGISLALNPLIAFLDSDDVWLPGKLTLQRELLAARPDVLFCFTDFRMHAGAGHEIPHYLQHWHGIRRPWEGILGEGAQYSSLASLPDGDSDFVVHIGDLYPALLEGPIVPAWTALVRRHEAGDALRFAEDVRICEDWECFARLARVGPAAFLSRDLAVNNSHDGPRLTAAHDQLQLLAARLLVTERVWGADSSFRKGHEDQYAHTISEIRLARAKWLVSHGHTASARSELRHVDGAHMMTRVLSAFPDKVTGALGSSRRAAIAAGHALVHLIQLFDSIVWPEL
jgi:glycosyltransferase involved in cell wall biosynthesis